MSLGKLKLAACALLLAGCQAAPRPRVIVLGFDGCDPQLVRRGMESGQLPNFQRLAALGSFSDLRSTTPPQSPVAWATVITGLDPGGHGIFDFLHRDPKKLAPIASMTAVEEGQSKLKRDGAVFWSDLRAQGIPSLLLKVPADFPPASDGSHLLTGMGTPDLLGSYGTFTLYSGDPRRAKLSDISGGLLVPVEAHDGQVRASLVGPQDTSLDFTASLDPQQHSALLELGDDRLILKEGEWSDFLRVRFPLPGMVRFHLRSLEPFELYASPIQIDPDRPAQPISNPTSFARHLCHCCGPFYTQGMAEDTKALSSGALNDEEYLQQSQLVLDESWRLLRQGLREFHEGFFFCYLSATDLQSHLYWRTLDPEHPGHQAEEARRYGNVIPDTYQQADRMIGEVLPLLDARTTLLVLSDHGFAPFRRSFDLNAWLRQEGYLRLEPGKPLQEADWAQTRAYGVGFNGLYLNLAGREAHGQVRSQDRAAVLKEISDRLLALRDGDQQVLLHVYLGSEIYSGAHVAEAPDLVLGYQRGYRASWETALGRVGPAVLRDNLDHWSGDHLMDPGVVPGVLLSSRKLRVADPQLRDIAPTVLAALRAKPRAGLTGRNVLEE